MQADGFHFAVVCGSCGARGSKRQDHHGALTAWNVRGSTDPLNDFLNQLSSRNNEKPS